VETEFICRKCGEEFKAEWELYSDGPVSCSQCGTMFEVDFDEDQNDTLCGPWLGQEVGRAD
jgi:DNA-directed RNA polymerase subunit RPC12/RpoP